jgi:hypothetical protein
VSELDFDIEAARGLVRDSRERYFQDYEEELANTLEQAVAEVEKLRLERAEVRRAALEEAARVMCHRCKNGDRLVCKHGKYYLHRIDVDVLNDYVDVNCDAEDIHLLIAAGQPAESEREVRE